LDIDFNFMPRGRQPRKPRNNPRPRPPRRRPGRTMPTPPRRQPPQNASSGRTAMAIGRSLGTGLGNYVMPGLGGTIGGTLGSGLGWAFKKITGVGQYKIQANTLTMSGSPVPSFGENCIRLRHKEYLGDVLGTVNFSNTPYAINPGLASTFPWLASIAANYQEYYFAGLMFSFVSTSADALNSTNTALGKVIMATDYNASDNTFTTSTQMLATEFSNYGKPADNLLHAVECHPGTRPTKWQYVRSSDVGTGRDPRLYDMGIFQIASQGMQAAANIGGLWVAYDIILCKPIIPPQGLFSDSWFSTAASTSTTISPSAVSTSTRSIGLTLTGTAIAPVINFPLNIASGVYNFLFIYTGPSGATSYTSPVAGTTNLATSAKYDPLNISQYNSNPGSSTQTFFYSVSYAVTGTPASMTLQPAIVTGGVTASLELIVTALGP